jgi:hypothetical protein
MKVLPLSLGVVIYLLWSAAMQAHTVPALNLETEVSSGGRTIRFLLNIDPRLFMSTTPMQLPPVTAQWYRDLSPVAKMGAEKAATDFIAKSLALSADEHPLQPTWVFVPIDGADNTPMSEKTTELHMLAAATLSLPEGSKSFLLRLSQQCPAALTMLSVVDGKAARRMQVLFPGEESRPLTWAEQVVAAAVSTPAQPPSLAPAAADSAESAPWYEAPLLLGWKEVMSIQGWPSLVFVICLLMMRRGIMAALIGLLLFHFAHLMASYLCGWRLWVVPMLDYAWPVCCLALLLVGKRPLLLVTVLSALAFMHVLDEWPTAVTPGVALAAEFGFGLATAVLLLIVSFLIWLLEKLRGKKRGSRGDSLSLGGMWR